MKKSDIEIVWGEGKELPDEILYKNARFKEPPKLKDFLAWNLDKDNKYSHGDIAVGNFFNKRFVVHFGEIERNDFTNAERNSRIELISASTGWGSPYYIIRFEDPAVYKKHMHKWRKAWCSISGEFDETRYNEWMKKNMPEYGKTKDCGMDYKKLEENTIKYLDSMSDEELQSDFDNHVEKMDEWAKKNPDDAVLSGYGHPDEPIKKSFCLAEYEGPITMVEILDNGYARIWDWLDQDSRAHIWIVFDVRQSVLYDYIQKRISLDSLLHNAVQNTIFSEERNGDEVLNKQRLSFEELLSLEMEGTSVPLNEFFYNPEATNEADVVEEWAIAFERGIKKDREKHTFSCIDEPEPTALAKSPFPTREELDELNRIGLRGVMEKQEMEERRQNFIDGVKFWWPIVVGSIVGGVVGAILFRFLKG